jgi:hypothetical protein
MNRASTTASRSWWQCMLETPAGSPGALSRYTFWNGVMYLALGGALYLAPDVVRQLLFMAPFAGHEEGYMRLLGVAVAIIGWFYVFGARTRADSFALSTVADRMAVPVLLLPLYFTGQMPPGPIFAFALLDPLLGLGAYLIWRRQRPFLTNLENTMGRRQ